MRLVHTAGPTAYGVSFPDFPGAVTAARTIDEAVEHARDYFSFLIRHHRMIALHP